MESEASCSEHIEYVELLDDVYEESSEMIEIHDDEMHEIVTITDEQDANMIDTYDEIQYVEGEVEVEENSLINHENQTIFIHDGRKYVISTDQLNSGDQTIILDEEDGQLIQQDDTDQMIENIDDNVYYTSDLDADTSSRQFAVLKDGKLHLTNSESNDLKLRHFETSITNYDEVNESDDDDDDDETNEKQLSEITGKNLITGQTISLSGILEKMRRKTNVKDLIASNKQRNVVQQETPDYVLVPPVTRRVVVGRTQDGKRLVGRILQIQKKIQPQNQNDVQINQSSQNTFSISMPTKRTKRKVEKPKEIKTEVKSTNQVVQLRYVTRSNLDENVARTLAGLMDLESINKRLKGRRLIVRHIQRRSNDGKIIPGSKKIAYYCGHLQQAGNTWTFVQEFPSKFDQNGIDLPQNDEGSDKVNLRLSDDGTLCPETPEVKTEPEETLTLYLTETQDEYGKKKTKVTIPQFVAQQQQQQQQQQQKQGRGSGVPVNEEYVCKFCGKKFQTLGSLKRHSTTHDHSLRPLQCLTCLGRFTDESSLKKHMILHTGLRPHKCHLCDRSFAHRGDLNFHLRTHDPVKRYECNVCKKQFNRHSNMLRHAEIHRPNNKDTELTNNESIIILKSMNNEEEFDANDESEVKAPFTCDQCGIQYNFSSSLTRHIVNIHLKQSDE